MSIVCPKAVAKSGILRKLWSDMDMLDSLDEQLLQLLEKDGRQSSEALAKQLRVSPSTIRRRVRKLIQSGVLCIVAVADPGKIGFPLAAVIAFDVAHDKLDLVMEKLSSRPEVT